MAERSIQTFHLKTMITQIQNFFMDRTRLFVEIVRESSNAFLDDFQKRVATYKQENYDADYSTWKPLAEQGDAYSQHNFVNIFREGEGLL